MPSRFLRQHLEAPEPEEEPALFRFGLSKLWPRLGVEPAVGHLKQPAQGAVDGAHGEPCVEPTDEGDDELIAVVAVLSELMETMSSADMFARGVRGLSRDLVCLPVDTLDQSEGCWTILGFLKANHVQDFLGTFVGSQLLASSCDVHSEHLPIELMTSFGSLPMPSNTCKTVQRYDFCGYCGSRAANEWSLVCEVCNKPVGFAS